MKLIDRFKHGWNAFTANDKNDFSKRQQSWISEGYGTMNPGHMHRSGYIQAGSIAQTAFNRIALDASMVDIKHVKIDSDDNQTTIDSALIYCLSSEANIDQTGKAFIHDLVYSLLEEGVVAVVPVDTTGDPTTGSYDVYSMRVGRITQWYPRAVKIDVYNDRTGRREEIILPKQTVAIIENPLYSIINGDNSTLQRLARKLSMVDYTDDLIKADKLNLLIQFPYQVRSEEQVKRANERISNIEKQLSDSKYGIGYLDATEKVTQLNKSIPTNLMDDIKYLTEQFYNALGLTQNIFNGTASESETRAYYNRTIDPIVSYILEEFNRSFITKTARSQGQRLVAYRDPFKLVPVEQLATIADTFSRNAILSSNEIRQIVGFGPSSDPNADKLTNKNIADVNQDTALPSTSMGAPE